MSVFFVAFICIRLILCPRAFEKHGLDLSGLQVRSRETFALFIAQHWRRPITFCFVFQLLLSSQSACLKRLLFILISIMNNAVEDCLDNINQ